MKKIKNILFLCILTLLIGCFAAPNFSGEKTASAAIDIKIFDFISLSQEGQKITAENLIEIDNKAYLVSNDSVTISTNPFTSPFKLTEDTDLSNYHTIEETLPAIEYNEEKQSYPDTFTYNNVKYYFRLLGLNLSIYRNDPSVALSAITTSNTSSLLKYSIDETTKALTITLVNGYSLKSDAPNSVFAFTAPRNAAVVYEVNFLRPIVDFSNASNQIVSFNTFEKDAGGNYVPPKSIIQNEQTFAKLHLEFLNNGYTETNKLYFDINYNGFVYFFELYSKEYDGNNLLFVNYLDENATESKITYLATKLIPDQVPEDFEGEIPLVPDPNHTISAENLTSPTGFETFSIHFTKTGRYEIDIYDSTFTTGMNTFNHMNSSFYIKEEISESASDSDKLKKDYDNVYIIAQTVDDDGNDIEYIVSESVLNFTTKITIKNLGVIQNLEDVISNIILSTATFGEENNIPTQRVFSLDEIRENIRENNGDFVHTLTEDAYYEISITPAISGTRTKKSIFTVVKRPKAIFEIDGQTIEASKEFKTEIYSDNKIIPSSMTFDIKFYSEATAKPSITIDKVFINAYEITLGKQKISIEKTKSSETSMTITIQGVGDMVVSVTINGKTTIYDLNSEKGNSTLKLKEYGTYSIKVTDSMGTQLTKYFTLEKKLNFSALALIILSCLLVGIITLFVLKARGKVKTR